MEASDTIESVVRTSYGRLLAFLATRTGDLVAAEDALGEALHAALRTWPTRGIPDSPDGWLLAVARNHFLSQRRRTSARETLMASMDDAADLTATGTPEAFPDERLKLLFICAHPAIDPAIRTPLMLQTVLGLDAARIASAFLVKPSAMGQRLVRAKNKIVAAGIPFEVPGPNELADRVDSVLDAIYCAYGAGWEHVEGADHHEDLAGEAIFLSRVVCELLADTAEAAGLLALLLHCEARRDARRSDTGAFVPLGDQDVTRWSGATLAEADSWLTRAATTSAPGRFQLEAAIQSAHASRRRTGNTPWGAIVLLYQGLTRAAPTVGAFVSQAAAEAEFRGPEAGLALLASLPDDRVSGYQPYWALRGHLLSSSEPATAALAFDRAIGWASDPAIRVFLAERRQRALSRIDAAR